MLETELGRALRMQTPLESKGANHRGELARVNLSGLLLENTHKVQQTDNYQDCDYTENDAAADRKIGNVWFSHMVPIANQRP
jgi:hypothetical protein